MLDPVRQRLINNSEQAVAVLSVAQLFEVAQAFGVRRDFDRMKSVMQIVKIHPERTQRDLTLVTIFENDMQRREGHPAAALRGLESLGYQRDCNVEFKRLFAMAECNRTLGLQESADSSERDGRLSAALALRRDLLKIARENPDRIPPDQRAYAIEGLLSDKNYLREADTEFVLFCKEYDQVVAQIDSPRLAGRAAFAKALLVGESSLLRKDFDSAMASGFSAFELASNDSYRVYAAIVALRGAMQKKALVPDCSDSPKIVQLCEFVKSHLGDKPQHKFELRDEITQLSQAFPALAGLLSD